MSTTLSSSYTLRLRQCRHDLTLALFFHEGPFWAAVAALRDRWHITPVRSIPWGVSFLFPPDCPEADFLPTDWQRNQATDFSALAVTWIGDINDLYDRLVPESCRPPGTTAMSPGLWAEFLAACVFYNPPPDALTVFADVFSMPPETIFDLDSMGGPTPLPQELRAELSSMVGSGVVVGHLASVRVWTAFVRELLHEVSVRIPPSSGVDLQALVQQVFAETDLLARMQERLKPERERIAIVVTPETTEDDVRAAFKLIRDLVPSSKGPGRPKPTDLVYVQAAVLREQGWTIPRIANWLGLALAKDEHGKPRRSNPVQQYVKRGQEILAQHRNSGN